MPATKPHAITEHPVEGFRSVMLPSVPGRPVRVYLPTDYQPKYAYPVVVIFHAEGESEEHAARLVPQLSRRNYIVLCIRGAVRLGQRTDGRPAFGWSRKSDPLVKAALAHALANYSVRADRVFLIGVSEGAEAAYRFALSQPSRVAGVIALNGAVPTSPLRANPFRVFIAHGSANGMVPIFEARFAAARLSASGAKVRFTRYHTSHRVHSDMLRDANRWIMTQITGKFETE